MKKVLLSLTVFLVTLACANVQAQTKDTIGTYSWGSDKHPGCLSGEVFLMNISAEYYRISVNGIFLSQYDPRRATYENFKDIGWKTKRMGYLAFDVNGEPVAGLRPVFVKKSELVKAGVLKK